MGRGRGWKGSWWEGGVRSSPTAKTSHAGIGVFCVTATCVAPPCAAPPCAAPPSAASSCAVPLCATPYCAARMQLVQCLNMPTVVFSQRSLLCRCNLSCTSSWCTSLWCTSPWCTFMFCIFLLCTLLGCNLYSASIRQQSSFACN